MCIRVRYCVDAPCQKGCPAGVDVAQFIRHLRYEDVKSAKRVIKTANPLGGICEMCIRDSPKGDWRNPVTYEDVVNKFRYLANRTYKGDTERTEKIVDFVNHLEEQPDMAKLMELVNDVK